MVITNDDNLANDLRSTRSHGWVRNRLDQKRIISNNKKMDSNFLFVTTGFNIRPTDINGAIGLVQLRKLENFLKKRDINMKKISRIIDRSNNLLIIGRDRVPENIIRNRKNRSHSWFNVPLVMKTQDKTKKNKIIKIFKKCRIETRPIIAGNLLKHPVMKNINYKKSGNFNVANRIFDYGFMIGCSPGLNKQQLNCLQRAIKLSNKI